MKLIPFFALIVSTTIAKPTTSGVLTPDLVSNPPSRRSSTKGHISCVEPAVAGGRVHRVSSTFSDDDSALRMGGDRQELLVVEFDPDAATRGPVNIEIPSTSFWDSLNLLKLRNLGAIPCNYSSASPTVNKYEPVDMVPSLSNCAILAATGKTKAGEYVNNKDEAYAPAKVWPKVLWHYTQSAIWHYDPKTSRLTPHWVNHDGLTVPLEVFYDRRRNGFGMTGSISAFQTRYYPVRECYLTFSEL